MYPSPVTKLLTACSFIVVTCARRVRMRGANCTRVGAGLLHRFRSGCPHQDCHQSVQQSLHRGLTVIIRDTHRGTSRSDFTLRVNRPGSLVHQARRLDSMRVPTAPSRNKTADAYHTPSFKAPPNADWTLDAWLKDDVASDITPYAAEGTTPTTLLHFIKERALSWSRRVRCKAAMIRAPM